MDNVTNGKHPRTQIPIDGDETHSPNALNPNRTSGSVNPIAPEYVVTVTPNPTDSPSSDWMGQHFTTFVVSVTVGSAFLLLIGVVLLLLCRRYGWFCWSSRRRKAKYASSLPCSKEDGQADGSSTLKKHAHTRTPTSGRRTDQEGAEFSGDLNVSPYLPRNDLEESPVEIVDMVIDADGDFDVEMISRDFSIGIPHVRLNTSGGGVGGGRVPQEGTCMTHPSSHWHRQNASSVHHVPYIAHTSTATATLQLEEVRGIISNDLYGDVSGNYYSPEELEELNHGHRTSEGNHNKARGLCGPVERDDDVPLRLASLDPSGVFQSTSFILSLPSGTTAVNPTATLLEEEEEPFIRRDAPPSHSTEQQSKAHGNAPNAAPNANANGVVSWSSNVGAFLTASKTRAAREAIANGTHEQGAEGEGEEQAPAAAIAKNSNSSIVIVVDDGGDENQQPQQPIPSSVVARRPQAKPVPHNGSVKGYANNNNNTNFTSRTTHRSLGDGGAYSDEEVRSVGSDEADVYHKGNVLLPSYLFGANTTNTTTTNGKEASHHQREREEKEEPLGGNWGDRDRGGEPLIITTRISPTTVSKRSQHKSGGGAQHHKVEVVEEEERGEDRFAKSSTSYNKPLYRSLATSPSGSSSSVSLYGPRYNEPPYQSRVAIETAIDASPPEGHSEHVRGAAAAAGEAAVTMANKEQAVSPTNRVASWAREQALRGAIE